MTGFIGTRLSEDNLKRQFRLPKQGFKQTEEAFIPQSFFSSRSFRPAAQALALNEIVEDSGTGRGKNVGFEILKALGKRHFENIDGEMSDVLSVFKFQNSKIKPGEIEDSFGDSDDEWKGSNLKARLEQLEGKNDDLEFMLDSSYENEITTTTQVEIPSDFFVRNEFFVDKEMATEIMNWLSKEERIETLLTCLSEAESITKDSLGATPKLKPTIQASNGLLDKFKYYLRLCINYQGTKPDSLSKLFCTTCQRLAKRLQRERQNNKFVPTGYVPLNATITKIYPRRTVTSWRVEDRLLFKRFNLEPVISLVEELPANILSRPSIEAFKEIFASNPDSDLKRKLHLNPLDLGEDNASCSISIQPKKKPGVQRPKASDLF